MEIESLEIFQYLQSCDPISHLEEAEQKSLVHEVEIIYAKRGAQILKPGEDNGWLYVVRSGAVERIESDGTIIAKFGEKDFFGHASIRRGGNILRQVIAVEDTLLYRIPADNFLELFEHNPYFRYYFERNDSNNNFFKDIQKRTVGGLNHTHVKELLHETPQLVDHKVSVADCARLMQSTNSTSLLITQNEKVKGIVTDRAFCTKIVAENLSHESPVGLIMSDQLKTIDEDATASEALMKMARFNFRHLPVTSNDQVIGVLTATDLIHRQSNNPIYLVNQIYKSQTIAALKRHSEGTSTALMQMVDHGLSATDIGYTISSIGRAINQQLIKLAEHKLGPPPISYAWVIAGSLARNDQTAKSDQDNMLILSDDYNPSQHAQYFESLANLVCDGLNDCGYVYCPGDVMASNTKWRQPLSRWKEYFHRWIVSPEPKALMYASIFFDLRSIYGDQSILNQLQQYVSDLVSNNKMFLNYMAANAMQHTPPLGFFRNFVLEDHGTEEKALNMKKRGVVPITDLARVYALSSKAYPINTISRLEASHQANELSKPGLLDLRDAFEFLSDLRIQHQARQIKSGKSPDNYLPPEELSSLERRHLKDTFEVIRTYQNAMASRYQTGRLG